MRYMLIIKRIETNEQYEKEMEEWERGHRHNFSPDMCHPQRENEIVALQSIVNEEEFNATRRALLDAIDKTMGVKKELLNEVDEGR